MSLTVVETSATDIVPVEDGQGQAIEGRSPWRLALARVRSDRVAVAAAVSAGRGARVCCNPSGVSRVA